MEQAFDCLTLRPSALPLAAPSSSTKEPIAEYLRSNIVLMKNMIADGYQDAKTLQRRIEKVEAWLANPNLLEADKDAEYAAVIEIDLADIKEPIVCCPNDPDDAKFLSEVAGTKIDEAFIGSCMTNIGHFRAAAKLLGGQRDIPVKLWVAPPTKMDQSELIKGRPLRRLRHRRCAYRNARLLAVHGQPGPGARRCDGDFHLTRNFPNRLGRTPTCSWALPSWPPSPRAWASCPPGEYLAEMGVIDADKASVYRYMNFDQIEEYAGCQAA